MKNSKKTIGLALLAAVASLASPNPSFASLPKDGLSNTNLAYENLKKARTILNQMQNQDSLTSDQNAQIQLIQQLLDEATSTPSSEDNIIIEASPRCMRE